MHLEWYHANSNCGVTVGASVPVSRQCSGIVCVALHTDVDRAMRTRVSSCSSTRADDVVAAAAVSSVSGHDDGSACKRAEVRSQQILSTTITGNTRDRKPANSDRSPLVYPCAARRPLVNERLCTYQMQPPQRLTVSKSQNFTLGAYSNPMSANDDFEHCS